MAKPDVKSPGPNLQPAHPSSSDDESWKTSPSRGPEGTATEPAIKTLQEDTDRAARQLRSQERQAHGPAPEDPLRQPGESAAAPKRQA
jgi:hypothetical protein